MEDILLSDLLIKSSIKDYKLSFVDSFDESLLEVYNDGDVIIIDQKIFDLYKDKISNDKWKNNVIVIKATEEQKSFLKLAPIIDELINNGFRKNNTLFSIGGGIIQDITAFIASIMYRGVNWIHIPTTLLAQGDSCIGSKTSINFGKFKNQLGNFFAPKQIFIDVNFLKTLDEADLISGLGEMAHYFLVSSQKDFLYFKSEYHHAKNNLNILKALVIRSLEIKKSYIEIDEFDQNERQVFNYGHSFGHAIESLTNYRIPHGIAVSIGMDMSNFMSVKYGYMTDDTRQEMRGLLKEIWTGYSIDDIKLKDMETALLKDKKNQNGKLGLILSRGPGKTFKEFKELNSDFSNWLQEFFNKEFNS